MFIDRRRDVLSHMPSLFASDVQAVIIADEGCLRDDNGVVRCGRHSEILQYAVDSYDSFAIKGTLRIDKRIEVSKTVKIVGGRIEVATQMDRMIEVTARWAVLEMHGTVLDGKGMVSHGLYREEANKGPLKCVFCGFNGFTEAAIWGEIDDSWTDSILVNPAIYNSGIAFRNPPGNGTIIHPYIGSCTKAFELTGGVGKFTVIGGLVTDCSYVLSGLNGNYYKPIEFIEVNIENLKTQFFYLDSGTNIDISFRSCTFHAASGATAIIDTTVYSLTGGNVLFENCRISPSSATDVIKFGEYWNVAVIGRILKGTTNVDIGGSCRVIHLNRVGYLALPIYTSLPSIATKGAMIIYYDGTYYYIAVYNGSTWLKVQLS